MSVESEIYARLTGLAGVTALVLQRVYPNVAPQNVESPYITYRRVSETRMRVFNPGSGLIHESRFQFDLYTQEFGQVVALEAQVIAALNEWDNEAGTPPILDSTLSTRLQTWEQGSQLHHAVLDFVLSYRE